MKNDTKKVLENGSLVVSVVLERKTFNKDGDDIPYVAVSVYSKDKGLYCYIPSSNFTIMEKDYLHHILKEKNKLEIHKLEIPSILHIEQKQFTNDHGDVVVYYDYFISNDYFRKLKLDKKALSYREHGFLRSLIDG